MEQAASNLTVIVPAQRLTPAFPPAVKLGLTALYTALYALLFLSVYAQLWLVLLYRHKKLSYQTVFLFLCLLWATLRTTLFSFYFKNTLKANQLGPFLYWLLYCCPVCLQFFTLTLMNLYFAQVVFKAKAKYHPNMTKGLLAVRGACLGASLLFLAVNVACAFVVRLGRAEPWAVVLTRVLINDSLFVLGAITLALCLCLGTTVCQTAAMGGTMVLLHASRACYNLVALALSSHTRLDSFDYDWYNVSDQADLITDLGDQGYLIFGLILFVWELLPTALLVGFFRVHRPPQDLSTNHIINGQLGGSRSYFFDHPGQYENEGPPRRKGSSLAGRLGSGSWYGAIGRTGRDPDWLGGQPPTTPLLFSQVTVQASHHHSLYSTPQT
ncbi:ectonucleoside triphosphate diphosphohydrolase 3 [Platysternon megacephalum]|uniref:Ectonucleoside triphosphate diphosphohydrolase 3 n=1 Tax=Platysternon megacephalum TaxID=55544 RepID=A0A4D9EY31_9SAUR|nr:ectonucleoside triphosphate diphosphohydrolase 3 [Platysternon megacephalum]